MAALIATLRKLQDLRAKFDLSRKDGVNVHPSVHCAWRKIRFVPGCQLRIGEGSIIESAIAFDRKGGNIRIGMRTFIGASNLVCAESIEIGDDVLISWGCNIVDHNSHTVAWSGRARDVALWREGKKDWASVERAPISIGNKAWIGFNAIILKGITIGEGAIVAAGALVTRDVPSYTIVAGNPARTIRELRDDEH